MSAPAQNIADLMDDGVYAYKQREFKKAIEKLNAVLDLDAQHWRAKMYLAMSHYHGGDIFTAHRQFTFLRDNCTDAEIRAKSESALKAMNSQVQAPRMLEM